MKHFASQILKHPQKIGAIAPSSSGLARLITGTPALKQAGTIVEIGPGMGAFTQYILDRKRPEALFLAVELNASFVSSLKTRYPGVEICQDSAANVKSHLARHGRETCDCIVCGMPWGVFDEPLQRELMSAIDGVLEPGGEFSTFSYLGSSWLSAARRFRGMLPDYFKQVTITPMVWLNIPPAFVYRCVK